MLRLIEFGFFAVVLVVIIALIVTGRRGDSGTFDRQDDAKRSSTQENGKHP